MTEEALSSNVAELENRESACSVPDSLQEPHNKDYVKFVYKSLPIWKDRYGIPVWEKSVRISVPNIPTSQVQLIPLADTATHTLSAFLLLGQHGFSHQVLFVKRDSLQYLLEVLNIPESQNEAAVIADGFEFLVGCYADEGGVILPRCWPDPGCPTWGPSFWQRVRNFVTSIWPTGGGSSGGGSSSGGIVLPTWFPTGGGFSLHHGGIPNWNPNDDDDGPSSSGGAADNICTSLYDENNSTQDPLITELDAFIANLNQFGEDYGLSSAEVFELWDVVLPRCYGASDGAEFRNCVVQSLMCYYHQRLIPELDRFDLDPWCFFKLLQNCENGMLDEHCLSDHPVLEFANEMDLTEEGLCWLLENPEGFEATKMFFQATNFDADAIKSFQWTIAADLAGVAGLDDLYSTASMAILMQFTDCCPDGIDDYDGWTNVPNGQAYMEELEDEMLMLKQLHPNWPDFLIRHWAQFKLFKEDIHTVLDACGLVEGLGAGCDLANGIFYALEGNGTDAGLSFLGAVPGGFYVTGTRVMKKAVETTNGKVRKFVWRESGGSVVFSHASSYREVWKDAYPALNSADNIAHHVIPQALWDHDLVQKAARANPDQAHPFHMNMPSNGWPVHQSRHTSNHGNYSTQIQNRMQEWFNANPNATPEEAAEAMTRWQDDLKALMGINPSGPNINTLIIPPIQ